MSCLLSLPALSLSLYPALDRNNRTQQLFQVLEDLFLPRVPLPGRVSASHEAGKRRPVYLPKVAPGQRAILDFLRDNLGSGWQLALRLLAKYSVVGGGGGVDVVPGVGDSGVIMAGGEEARAGVTVECVKEAAAALCSMMSDRVPRRDRALALDGLLDEVKLKKQLGIRER